MRVHLCPHCDVQLPDGARFCPSCGGEIAWPETNAAVVEELVDAPPIAEPNTRDVTPDLASAGSDLPLPENIAAVISYVTIIPAAVFLYLEPFRRNRFVRFHALQHLLLFATAVACAIAATILWTVLELIPFMRVLVFPFAGLIGLAWLFVWLLLVVKAYNHKMFKLPWIGNYADQWSQR